MSLLTAAILTPCWGAALVIVSGPRNFQVVQRQSTNSATLEFTGTAQGISGTIECRVNTRGQPIEFPDWRTCGAAASGGWNASITLSAGGPYTIGLRPKQSEDITRVENVLIGDLWVLAGQSNMEGNGLLVNVEAPDERVHNYGVDGAWRLAEEPLHAKPGSARKKGAGLGLPFAVEMVKRTGVPIGLIPCARGGTWMELWDPSLAKGGEASLYGTMLRRFREAGGHVKGVLWYQGESDARPGRVDSYEAKFTTLIESIRRDFAAPNFPFFYVQIGRNIATDVPHANEWARTQEIQRTLPRRVAGIAMTASIDLELEDDVHVDTAGLKRLGKRLAKLASGMTGPEPVSASWNDGVVEVRFSGVNGRLTATGRIAGFTVYDPGGRALPVISKVMFASGDGASVLLRIQSKLPPGATVRYGFGRDPFCNVVDEADMPLPAFGPLPIAGLGKAGSTADQTNAPTPELEGLQ